MSDITVTTYEGSVAVENFGYTVLVSEGHTIPAGGTEGQRLAKASDSDYDVEWVTASDSGSTVSVDADGTVTVDGTPVELATDAQLAAHEADTTNIHGIADTSLLETTAGSAAKVAAHEADTTNVHGIANTANLETTTGAQAKADAAQAAAEATADAALDAHVAAGDPHPQYLTAAEGNAAYDALGAATSAVAIHSADTTGVHGIADTADLVLDDDARLTDSRTPTGAAGGVLAGTYPNPSFAADMATQAELDAHASDTTAIHGIADTSALIVEGDSRLTNSRTPSGAAGGVLSGTYPNPGFATDMATQAELDAHVNDTSAAHAASAISYAGSAGLSATDVEAALDELDSEKAAASDLTGKIDKSTLDANTILYATTDDTPAALSVSASRIVGRKASGNISAMTLSEFLDFATGTRDGTKFLRDDGTWQTVSAGGLATDSLADAKGDVFAASAADAIGRLAVGSNGQVLTADSTQTLGVKWATPSSGGISWTQSINDALSSTSGMLTPNSGTWAINSGVLRQSGAGGPHRDFHGTFPGPSGIIATEVEMAYISGTSTRRVGLIYRGNNTASENLVLYIESSDGTTWNLKSERDGAGAIWAGSSISYSGSGYLRVGIINTGYSHDIYLGGVLSFQVMGQNISAGIYKHVGLYTYNCTADFKNLKAWTLLTSPFA